MWAIIEVFGRKLYAGFVTEEEFAGAKLARVEVPEVPTVGVLPGIPAFSKSFGGAAIYGLTRCSEDEARRIAANTRARPVESWLLSDPDPVRRLTQRDPEDAEEIPAKAPGEKPTPEADEDDIPFDRDADGEPYAGSHSDETPGRL